VDYRSLRSVVHMLTSHGFRLKIAPGFTFKSSVPKILKRIYPSIRFVGQPESLARSFFEADLAMVTPGTRAFEAAAVGTPALYLPLDKKQDAPAKSFEEKGLGLNLSQMASMTESLLLEKIASLTQEKRIAMGSTGKELVDGLGANRVISLLSSL